MSDPIKRSNDPTKIVSGSVGGDEEGGAFSRGETGGKDSFPVSRLKKPEDSCLAPLPQTLSLL